VISLPFIMVLLFLMSLGVGLVICVVAYLLWQTCVWYAMKQEKK
jgi:hypothetical protein